MSESSEPQRKFKFRLLTPDMFFKNLFLFTACQIDFSVGGGSCIPSVIKWA